MKSKLFNIVLFVVPFLYLGFLLTMGMGYFFQLPSSVAIIALMVFVINTLVSIIRGFIYLKKHITRNSTILGVFLLLWGIIGLLTVIYLIGSSLHGRPKSPNSSIKSSLSNTRAIAELVYEEFLSYEGICVDDRVNNMLDIAEKNGRSPVKCFGDKDSFVLVGKLKEPYKKETHWCTDSIGSSKAITTQEDSLITSANTLCPI